MRLSPRLRWAGCALGLLATGCTTMKDVPRSDLNAKPERQNVRVVTTQGLEYIFDFARVNGDTLVGYRRRDVPGRNETYDTLPIPFDDLSHVTARAVDWKRTGLISVAAVGTALAVGLHVSNNGDSGSGEGSGGGGTIRPPQ